MITVHRKHPTPKNKITTLQVSLTCFCTTPANACNGRTAIPNGDHVSSSPARASTFLVPRDTPFLPRGPANAGFSASRDDAALERGGVAAGEGRPDEAAAAPSRACLCAVAVAVAACDSRVVATVDALDAPCSGFSGYQGVTSSSSSSVSPLPLIRSPAWYSKDERAETHCSKFIDSTWHGLHARAAVAPLATRPRRSGGLRSPSTCADFPSTICGLQPADPTYSMRLQYVRVDWTQGAPQLVQLTYRSQRATKRAARTSLSIHITGGWHLLFFVLETSLRCVDRAGSCSIEP